MVKITWNDITIKDLEEIEEFIFRDSSHYASITIEKLFSRVSLLHSFPQAGRIVPEFNNSSIRELIEGSYRIVYLARNATEVTILRVHHSGRLMQ